MSNELKVGDVCEVIGYCCDVAQRMLPIGSECQIVPTTCCAGVEMACLRCGWKCTQFVTIVTDALPESKCVPMHWPTQFLRRRPPKALDDAEPRVDHLPADPDAWDLAQWHPDRTKETA